MAAVSATRGQEPPRYRRHRPLPAIVLLVVLGLAATFVWLKVINSTDDPQATTRCAPPTAPPAAVAGQPAVPLGQALTRDALDRTAPMAPNQALLKVRNANNERGKAGATTEVLRELGFEQVVSPDDDTVYPGKDMRCRAQIRFGQQGSGAARTMSLLEPCAELVRDTRQDATVDFAIGTKFDELRPSPEARKILLELKEFAEQHPAEQGGLQSEGGAKPDLDAALLTAARDVKC